MVTIIYYYSKISRRLCYESNRSKIRLFNQLRNLALIKSLWSFYDQSESSIFTSISSYSRTIMGGPSTKWAFYWVIESSSIPCSRRKYVAMPKIESANKRRDKMVITHRGIGHTASRRWRHGIRCGTIRRWRIPSRRETARGGDRCPVEPLTPHHFVRWVHHRETSQV